MKRFVMMSLFLAAGCLEEDLGDGSFAIQPGDPVPPGDFEAVVRYDKDLDPLPPEPGDLHRSWAQRCTATMITKSAVLLAAHCFCYPDCDEDALDVTGSERRVVFDDPATTGPDNDYDLTVTGTEIIPHPSWSWDGGDGDLYNDFAIMRIDEEKEDGTIREFDDYTAIAPMAVAATRMTAGEIGTIVGYGLYGDDCENGDGNWSVRRFVAANLLGYGHGGELLRFPHVTCEGDSGGPAVDPSGRVAGVDSTGGSYSMFGSTDYVYPWLQAAACPHYDVNDPDASQCTTFCRGTTGEGDCDQDYQCVSGTVCARNIGKVGGLPSDWDLCWGTNQMVRVYQHTNYGGAQQGLPPAAWTSAELGVVGNDAISSFTVPAGMTARLCTGGTGGGPCQDFTTSVSSLSGSLMDNVSYVNVIPGARLYAGTLFEGAAQTFREGTYLSTQLTGVGNNQASSLNATPGVSVRLCDGSTGAAPCHELWGPITVLPFDIDNRTSYVQVRLGVTLYDGEDYTGASQAFPVGAWAGSSLSVVGDNEASSLVVSPGRTATICDGVGGTGECRIFGSGWYSFVGFEMDNRTSYLLVQ